MYCEIILVILERIKELLPTVDDVPSDVEVRCLELILSKKCVEGVGCSLCDSVEAQSEFEIKERKSSSQEEDRRQN